jgi:hypothetical protein
MTDRREVLSALIDREPVDPDVLARVLEEPEGRAMLVDFVRVRAAVCADEDDGAAPASAPDSVLQAPGRSRASRWMRVAAVFALLAAGAGGGAWVERYVSRERPPEPDRIVKFQPGVDWGQMGGQR